MDGFFHNILKIWTEYVFNLLGTNIPGAASGGALRAPLREEEGGSQNMLSTHFFFQNMWEQTHPDFSKSWVLVSEPGFF